MLVVNDMQRAFEASNDAQLLAAVVGEIDQAKQAGDAIVVVEYDPVWLGRTHDCLLEMLVGYKRVAYAVKNLDAGARSDFSCDHFRFCGVHTDACILKTVRGLRERLLHCGLSVVQNASRSRAGVSHDARIVQAFNRLDCGLV